MKDSLDKFTAELFSDKQCPVCASLLPVSKTRRFVYCSNACKFKAFRQREKLQRISIEGEKPQRISKKRIHPALSLNSVQTSAVSHFDTRPAPVINSVDDLKAFFNGF